MVYVDTTQYASGAEFFNGIAAVPNFWDSTEGGVLTKGDVTVTMSGSTITLTAGTSSTTISTGSTSYTFIAASENGLVAYHYGTNSTNSGTLAIGHDEAGNWAGARGGYSNNELISKIVVSGITGTDYTSGNLNTSSTTVNTQIIDLSSTKGNYIFKGLRRIIYAPSGIKSYCGRLTMPNGDKYIKCDAFALKYTE